MDLNVSFSLGFPLFKTSNQSASRSVIEDYDTRYDAAYAEKVLMPTVIGSRALFGADTDRPANMPVTMVTPTRAELTPRGLAQIIPHISQHSALAS